MPAHHATTPCQRPVCIHSGTEHLPNLVTVSDRACPVQALSPLACASHKQAPSLGHAIAYAGRRCCGHPSYDHLSHSGSLLGSSTAACALLAQLIQALKPPAQQQVLQHGRLAVVSAVAAAGGEGGGGSEGGGEGLGQHGGGEDAGWVEDVLLQSLDPSSLDYTPCGSVQRVGMAQGSPPAQHQQPPSLQALEQRQREQQPGRGGASELPPAPGAPPAPSAHVGLPPLASLLLGVSGLLRDSMGVWLELGPVPLVDIEGTGSPSGAAPEAAAAECSPARQQRHLLWHVLGRLQQPQGPGGQWGGAGQCAGSKQATLPQQQATQQATQDCGAPGRPEPSAFGAQQGGVIVAALHHEGLGCVGTLVIHATAACGTRCGAGRKDRESRAGCDGWGERGMKSRVNAMLDWTVRKNCMLWASPWAGRRQSGNRWQGVCERWRQQGFGLGLMMCVMAGVEQGWGLRMCCKR